MSKSNFFSKKKGSTQFDRFKATNAGVTSEVSRVNSAGSGRKLQVVHRPSNGIGSSNGGSWMSVKRTGVDDASIHKDAEKARLERAARKAPHKDRKRANLKKNQRSDDGSDSYDDSFIAHSSDEEELLTLSPDKSTSEEEMSALAPPAGRARRIANKHRAVARTDEEEKENENIFISTKKIMNVDISSGDDDDLILPKPAFGTKANPLRHFFDNKTNSKGKAHVPNPKGITNSSRQAPKFSSVFGNDSSGEEDWDVKLAIRKSLSMGEDDTNSSETSTPKEELRALEIARKRSLKDNDRMTTSAKTSSTQWLLESDSPTAVSSFKRLKKTSLVNTKVDTYRIKSKSFQKQANLSNTMIIPQDMTVQEFININSDVDSENDDAVSFHNEECDDKNETATLLKTVNELSSRVLHRMQSFCYQLQENDDGAKPGNVQGMIVDGALALSTFAASHGTKAAAETTTMLVSKDALSKCLAPEVVIPDYQLIGVNWMALMDTLECNDNRPGQRNINKRAKSNVNGVLADEMGLGKTVQTIAFLAWLKYGKTGNRKKENISQTLGDSQKESANNNNDDSSSDEGEEETQNQQPALSNQATSPHLIVVPASVLSNWMREFEKISPGIVVLKYHGTQEERMDLRSTLRRRPEGSPEIDVLLTTFSYFSNEKSDDRKFLGKIKFDYMVVDEAHSLKNPKGKRYQELDKIKTSHRLLLTGTPIQNNPGELLALLCFLMPLFQSRGEDIANDGGVKLLEQITKTDRKSKNKTNSNCTEEERVYKDLKQMLAPFILRRLKIHVVGQALLPKLYEEEMVPFDEATRGFYDSILKSHFAAKDNRNKVVNVDSIMSDASKCKHIFTLLRKAANHPLLLRTRHTSPVDKEALANHLFDLGFFGNNESCTIQLVRSELETFSDFDIHLAVMDILDERPSMHRALSKFTLSEGDLFCSPKFKRLQVLLPDLLKQGHRVLIFSQWTRCLDLLGCFLESLQLSFLRLDGSTNINQRQNLIDEFNNDATIPVFLLSTRAGGMGINLTSADTVICHDLDFNPFNDLQAEDRCHRIGQTKQVTIYKMITEGTVDGDIYAMQKRKAEMTAAIFEHENSDSRHQKKGTGPKPPLLKQEKEDLSSILKVTINRFLSLPSADTNK